MNNTQDGARTQKGSRAVIIFIHTFLSNHCLNFCPIGHNLIYNEKDANGNAGNIFAHT
jgi:hypothetical protein